MENIRAVDDFGITYLLALATLIGVLVLGVWQMRRARQAKEHHEHSAMTDAGEAQRKAQP
jgi:cytochrome oxidase assembly protein ShyY1